MARTVSLQSIADKARLYADMRGTGFINDTEILSLINDAYCELYYRIVGATENYYVSTSTIDISPGTDTYDLPADFYKLIGADFKVNEGAYITLNPFTEGMRNISLTANSNLPTGQVRLRYVPAPTQFTSLSQTFDGVAGWERMVAMGVAIDMLNAEETDPRPLQAKYDEAVQRVINDAAPRDLGMPATVVDVYRQSWLNIYGALKYRLYGNTIHFLSTEYLGADLYPGFI